MRRARVLLIGIASASVFAAVLLGQEPPQPMPSGAYAARCEALMSLALPETVVKQAGVVAAGAFAAPNGRGRGAAFAT